MSRPDLLLHLAALVARRALSQAQAAALLARFDAGELDEADLPTLAAPASNRLSGPINIGASWPRGLPRYDGRHSNDWLLALLAVLLLTRGNTTRPLNAAKRRQARTTLRSGFETTMAALAVGVTTGALAVGAWQSAMQAQIGSYTRQMAVAGAGTLPGAATQAAVEAGLAEQWPFLQTFALIVAAKGAASAAAGAAGAGGSAAGTGPGGSPPGGMSTASVAARSRMYGNVGHAAFWQGQGDDPQAGYIERWVSKDDGKVCPNCARLQGQAFLPGDGPMPGSVCFGTCRCERVLEYNPDEYAKLGGASAPRKAVQPSTFVSVIGAKIKGDSVRALLPPKPPLPPGGSPPSPQPPRQVSPGQPLGIKVSERLALPLSSPDRTAFQEAMAAIDSVHGDGDLATIPLRRAPVPRAQGGNKNTQGGYISTTTGKALEIRIPEKTIDKQLTLVHEAAHWLDEQRLHMTEGVHVNRGVAAANARVMEAINSSRQHDLLNDLLAGRRSLEIADPNTGVLLPYTPRLDYLRYLLQDDELWARAYAQYVSVQSQSPGLLNEFMRLRGRPGASEQWADDDFLPIANAIDESMRLLGWRK